MPVTRDDLSRALSLKKAMVVNVAEKPEQDSGRYD
jgi:hypothetical protein